MQPDFRNAVVCRTKVLRYGVLRYGVLRYGVLRYGVLRYKSCAPAPAPRAYSLVAQVFRLAGAGSTELPRDG